MSDITITIPLSWLSFLTWSGFWVVYLYIGLTVLLSTMAFALRNSMRPGGRRIMDYWRNDTKGLLYVWFALCFGWPFGACVVLFRVWGCRS